MADRHGPGASALVVTVVAAAALMLLGVPVGSTASTAVEPELGTPPVLAEPLQVQSEPQFTAATAATAIDTSSRQAVQDAYNQWWLPLLALPTPWNGNVASCTPGTQSSQQQEATRSAVNFMRALAGLSPVTFDPALSAKAQKAALIMEANGQLNHYPPSSFKCWTADGADGAATSSLAYRALGPAGVQLALRDPGAQNVDAGHRRWTLYPPTQKMGSGYTTVADALVVSAAPVVARDGAEAPVAWPTAGYFPVELEPGGRWSLSQKDANFTNATVTVTSGGTSLPVTVESRSTGYGDPAIVWKVTTGAITTDRTFTVTVSGIASYDPANPVAATQTYTTTFFRADLTPSTTTTSSIDVGWPTFVPPTSTTVPRPLNYPPRGQLEEVVTSGRRVTMRSWAYDPNLPGGGLAVVSGGGGVTVLSAATEQRSWLASMGVTPRSGTTAAFDLPAGTHDVCSFALDHDGRDYSRGYAVLGCTKVVVK